MAFVKMMANYDDEVSSLQESIKEQYGVDSEYDKETNTFYLIKESADNQMSLIAVKRLLTENEAIIKVDYK